MRKKIMVMCVVAVLLATCGLLSACSGQGAIKYVACDGGMALKLYEDTALDDKNYVVPAEIDGKPVVEIMAYSLKNLSYIETITIGADVHTISPFAIMNNKELKAINVDPDNANYRSVDGVLYTRDMKTLVSFPNKAVKKFVVPGAFVVPEGVEHIGDNAFYKCGEIVEITMPSTLKTVGERAFLKCVKLKKIALNEGLTHIKMDGFSYCYDLKNLVIPSTIEEIGAYALAGNAYMDSIEVRRPSASVKQGKKWIPIKAETLGTKIKVNWAE